MGIWIVPMFVTFFMLSFMNLMNNVILYVGTIIVGNFVGMISAITLLIVMSQLKNGK